MKPLSSILLATLAASPFWNVPLRTATCVARRLTCVAAVAGGGGFVADGGGVALPSVLSFERRVATGRQQQHDRDGDDEHGEDAADDEPDAAPGATVVAVGHQRDLARLTRRQVGQGRDRRVRAGRARRRWTTTPGCGRRSRPAARPPTAPAVAALGGTAGPGRRADRRGRAGCATLRRAPPGRQAPPCPHRDAAGPSPAAAGDGGGRLHAEAAGAGELAGRGDDGRDAGRAASRRAGTSA